MTTHRLKIFVKYADAIMSGAKTFEIRKNDRGYEVGDKIVFDVVTNEGYSKMPTTTRTLSTAKSVERPDRLSPGTRSSRMSADGTRRAKHGTRGRNDYR